LTTSQEGATKPAWSRTESNLLLFDTWREVANFYFIYGRWRTGTINNFKYGANNPKWSPDGKKILFSSSISLQELRKILF
jgi:Tol biopolymer transport system component